MSNQPPNFNSQSYQSPQYTTQTSYSNPFGGSTGGTTQYNSSVQGLPQGYSQSYTTSAPTTTYGSYQTQGSGSYPTTTQYGGQGWSEVVSTGTPSYGSYSSQAYTPSSGGQTVHTAVHGAGGEGVKKSAPPSGSHEATSSYTPSTSYSQSSYTPSTSYGGSTTNYQGTTSYPSTSTYGGTTSYGTTGTTYGGTTPYSGTTQYGNTTSNYGTTGTTYGTSGQTYGTTTYGSTPTYGTTATNYGTSYSSDPVTKAYSTDYVVHKGGEQAKSSGVPTTHAYTPTTTVSSTSTSGVSGQVIIEGLPYASWDDYVSKKFPSNASTTSSYSTGGYSGTTAYTGGTNYGTSTNYTPTTTVSHSTGEVAKKSAPPPSQTQSYTAQTSYPTTSTYSGYDTTSYGNYTPSTNYSASTSYTPSTNYNAYTPSTSYTPNTYTTSTTGGYSTGGQASHETAKKSAPPPSYSTGGSYSTTGGSYGGYSQTTSDPYAQFSAQTSAQNYNFSPSVNYGAPANYGGQTAQVGVSATVFDVKVSNTAPTTAKASGDQKQHNFVMKTVTGADGSTMQTKDFVDDPNSEFNQTLNRLKSTGQKFTDSQFPPEMKSLTGNLTEEELFDMHGDCGFEWSSLIWCRADDFYGVGTYKLFNDGVSWDDIKQGSLGDCYYLSVLAALSEWSHRIERLLVTKEPNNVGLYGVRVCDMGEWKEIMLDDFVPCFPDDKTPVFSKGNGNEMWVILLEKAWAKCYGSYAKIEAGLTREALHDLTSAPTKYFLTSDMTEDEKEQLWHDVLEGEKKNYCMTCGADDFGGDGADDLNEDIGIVASHAYSLLAAHEIRNRSGQTERLVELRNPWGKSEWKGAWADGAPEWTEELKQQLAVHEDDDGVFYMPFTEFLRYYSDVQICKVHDDYHYTHIKLNATHKNGNFFRMTVQKDGKYYITVNQQSKRHHENAENFQYSSVWLVMGKQNGDKNEHIQGVFKADREVFTEGHLTAGDYLLYVKVAWFDKAPRDFVLSSYGPDDVLFNKVSKAEVPNLIEKTYMDKGRSCKKLESYADLGQPNCFRAVELTDEGYGYIYYQNKSNKVLNETINFNVLEGLKLVKPFRGRQYQIKVSPGEEKIVLMKCDPECDGYRQSFSERANFT